MRRDGPVLKILVVFGLVVGFCILVYYMAAVPAPREQDRVLPAGGKFSIIRPHEWQANADYNNPNAPYDIMLQMAPRQSIGVPQLITVNQFRSPPDVQKLLEAGMKQSEFQNRPAFIFAGMVKQKFIWRAIFERDGTWFEIAFSLAAAEDVQKSGWWPYLQSFQTTALSNNSPSTRTTGSTQ